MCGKVVLLVAKLGEGCLAGLDVCGKVFLLDCHFLWPFECVLVWGVCKIGTYDRPRYHSRVTNSNSRLCKVVGYVWVVLRTCLLEWLVL